MRGSQEGSGIDQIEAGLDQLAAADVQQLDDTQAREQLQQLVIAGERLHAELIRRVDVSDRRRLAGLDGFASTKVWVQAITQMSGRRAHRLVKTARLLRELPKLADAFQRGEVPVDSVEQVTRLAAQVGVENVGQVEATLTDAACQLDPASFEVVCERVRAHLLPDGSGGDPAQRFARRAFTLSPAGGMVALRGQLDPEGGAALATALDAIMSPPAEGDERTAAQRRADALVELARRPLAGGDLPTVGGQRPQVGVLLYPQALSPETLATLAQAQQSQWAAARLRQFINDTPVDGEAAPQQDQPTEPAEPAAPAEPAGSAVPAEPEPAGLADTAGPFGPAGLGWRGLPVWARPGWNDPPHVNWVGPVPVETAQRIACDADIFRLILDPASGMPLDVGRSHRLVPHWIRRALWARDRTCRWTGCTVPVQWTDAHHLDAWADGGQTRVERLLSLCRHHHGLIHEGGWNIDLDPRTGEVHITRPTGVPYRLPQARSRSWNGPSTVC